MTFPKLILDPRNDRELIAQAIVRTRNASEGQITDFSSGSPAVALLEGQVFATAELLYYVNMLPEAVALEVYRLLGIQRDLGSYSTGSFTVQLTRVLATPFTLPAGYAFTWQNTSWILDEPLFIPPGITQGTVRMRCADRGSQYNVDPFGVNITTPLNYVQSVYNAQSTNGGSDLESIEALKLRCMRAARSRGVLVSNTDYIERTQDILGAGSKAWVFPLLSSDKETQQLGDVHVFALDGSLAQPNIATLQTVQGQLQQAVFVASKVWVSAPDFQPIEIDVTLTANTLDPALPQAILKAVEDYLSPYRYPIGSTLRLREIEYRIRSVPGVTGIYSTMIDQLATDRAMLNSYSLPKLELLTVTIQDPLVRSQTWYLGSGDGDTDGQE